MASKFHTRIVLSNPAEARRRPLASTLMVKMLEGPPPFLVSRREGGEDAIGEGWGGYL